MFSPVHLVVGLSLAKVIPGGELPVFLAGILSHLALDSIPHGDTSIGQWVHSAPDRSTKLRRLLPLAVADQIATLGLFLFLLPAPAFASVSLSRLVAGAVGSILPDYLSGIRDLLPHPPRWLEKLHRLHDRCHFRGRDPFTTTTGLLLQLSLVGLACWLAFR